MAGAILSAVSACAWNWRWATPGVHVVDGYYVASESACALGAADECEVAIRTATEDLRARDPAAHIVAAVTAVVPMAWVDSDGVLHGVNFGGLGRPAYAILTLDTGARRAVPLYCQGDQFSGGYGAPIELVEPAACQVSYGDMFRVGAPPPPH